MSDTNKPVQATTRLRVKVGRWFLTLGPGSRAWIVEFRPRGVWPWWRYWFSTYFGRLPDNPHVLRWRIGPLLLDRYRWGDA